MDKRAVKVHYSFHKAIIDVAVRKLGRELTEQELKFITSRGGYIALEVISDTVKAEPKEFIEHYLNSESRLSEP